ERGPACVPSEMKRETLQTARDELKAAGFRLQQLFATATQSVAGWYKTRTTAKGRRVVLRGKPLKRDELNEARALLGLPPLERVRGHLLRADDPRGPIPRRIETTDPVILDAERILGKDLLLAFPPSLGSYTLVADAKVTAEIEFEPIYMGSRSRVVAGLLDDTRLA